MRWIMIAVVALPLAVAWPAARVARAADVQCAPGSGPQFAGADLRSSGSELPHELRCANLGGARLDGVDLIQKDLSGAVLLNASLRGADLTQAALQGADLQGADLTGAQLGQADLTGANLSSAHLSGAHLGQVDLTRANLSSADLSRADVSQATFTDARLDGADISGALVVESQGDPASTAGIRGQFPLNEVAAVVAVLMAAALAAGGRPGGSPSADAIRRLEQGGVAGRVAFRMLGQRAAQLVGAFVCGCALFVLASIVLTAGTYTISGFSDLLVPSCSGITCAGGITRGPVGLVAVVLVGAPGLALCAYGQRMRAAASSTIDDAWARTRVGRGIALIAACTTVVAVVVAAATGSGPIVLGLLLAGIVLAALYWAREFALGLSGPRD